MEKSEHRKLAVEAFNKTWGYIDNNDRTKEQDIEMIHLAHASRFHWGFAGDDLNKARGEWQISRVYSLLSMGESALLHAQSSLSYIEKNNFKDFDLVFAYEAIAFANKILGNEKEKAKYLKLGYEAIEQVNKQGDKDYCKSELDNI